MAGRIRDNYPPVLRDSPYSLTLTATPLREEISGRVERPLLVLLGAARRLRQRRQPGALARRAAQVDPIVALKQE